MSLTKYATTAVMVMWCLPLYSNCWQSFQ